jgi:hypothetical protein
MKHQKVYKPKPRTSQQNRSLHLWFKLLAEEFNNAGYTVQLVLSQKMDLDWDAAKIKELLWRPAQKAIVRKKSTTELSKLEDIDKVYEHLNRHLAEKFFIHVPFPHEAGPAPLIDDPYGQSL